MNKLFLCFSVVFFGLLSSVFAQPQNEIRILIQVKDTGKVNVSMINSNNLWSKTDWIQKDKNGKIVFSEKVELADCAILKNGNGFYNDFFFLEKGQSLDLELKKGQFTIIGNTLPARQNRLLQSMEASYGVVLKYAQQKQLYNLAKEHGKLVNPPAEVSVSDLYDRVEKMIEQFVNENKDCSEVFLRFVRFENKYFRIKNSVNFPAKLSKTYHPFTPEELSVMSQVLEDSKTIEAVYSFNYRFVLHAYMDYLRIADPEKYLGDGREYLMNEIRLCNYVVHPLLKQYLAAVNLFELFYFNRKNEDYLKLVKQYAGDFAPVILDECKTFKPKVEAGQAAADFPDLSGEDTSGKLMKLSNLKGKWVFIDFWATWCGPCLNQIPYLLELEKRCTDLPVVFIGVSVDKPGDKEKWKKAVQAESLHGYQMLCSEKEMAYSQFAISGIPHFAILDPAGKLVMNGVPFPTTGVPERLLKDSTAGKQLK
jgi:thiol-disulfide isomerase/thioredoxin